MKRSQKLDQAVKETKLVGEPRKKKAIVTKERTRPPNSLRIGREIRGNGLMKFRGKGG